MSLDVAAAANTHLSSLLQRRQQQKRVILVCVSCMWESSAGCAVRDPQIAHQSPTLCNDGDFYISTP